MQSTLKVINSSNDLRSLYGSQDIQLQQTRSSEALGFHIVEDQANPAADQNLIELLKTEAAGTIYDSNNQTSSSYFNTKSLGAIAATLILAVLMVVLYRRLRHNKI